MNFFYLWIPIEDTEAWKLGDHMEVAGPIVVILLFLAERILSYREKKKERRANWYYSVIVVPHLKTINDFFHEYDLAAKKTLSVLIDLKNSDDKTRNDVKLKRYERLNELIREFELQFLMTLYMFNLKRYNSLLKYLSDMNDDVLVILDDPELVASKATSLHTVINNKKSVFFGDLYLAVEDNG